MAPPLPERLASLAGILFLALLPAAFVAYAAVGTLDGAPAAEWGAALQANGRFAQLSGYLHGLAGLTLAAFASVLLNERASSRAASWGRFAGLAWAASFLLGGAVIFASAEFAGYQQHPDGAKTALVLGHLLYANPLAALLGGLLALCAGLAAQPTLPRWFRPFSVALGGLTMLVTLLGGIGGIGLVGMAPLALWLVVAVFLVPLCTWRGARSA